MQELAEMWVKWYNCDNLNVQEQYFCEILLGRQTNVCLNISRDSNAQICLSLFSLRVLSCAPR